MAIKTSSQISIVDVSDGVDGEDGKMLYGTCSTAATTAAKVSTISGFSLYTGVAVSIKFTVTNSAASPTLNISGTGAKPIYYRGAAISAGYLAANRTYSFVYNGTQWEFMGDLNTDTVDRTRYNAYVKCSTISITAGNIIVGKDGVYQHLKSGKAFDINLPILYAGSNIAASGTGTNNYISIAFKVTTTQSTTLTAYKPVYIKGKLSGSTFTPISTAPLTQTAPVSEDGYQYILLGSAYTSEHVYLSPEHPMFQYFDGGFKSVNQIATEAAKTATNYMNFDDNGLVIGDMTAGTLGKNVLIDADSVDIRKGDTVLASYGEDVIYLGKNNRNATIDFCNGLGKIYNYNGHLALESDYVYIESSTYPHSANISLNATSTGEKIAISAERMDGSANVYGSIIDMSSEKIDIGTYWISPSEPGGKNFYSRIYSKYGEGTTITGKTTISGTLVLSKTTDASGKANNSPALIVGGTATTAHIEIDSNEIMAKSNGTTPSGLSLNSDGGNVYIGSGGSGNLIGICQIVKMGSSTATIPYQSNRTKALIEFWKTAVGSGPSDPSCTVYDSVYVTGLSSSMTAVNGVNIKAGPDFAFVYSISAAGAISVSGNFSKYRVTYFN
mgnify:CR=1 FL=1